MTPDFNPVARIYRFLEYAAFGPALWRRRCAFLPLLGDARRVLMAGEGDGRFLAAFLLANPHATVSYIDASSAMAALARARVNASPRVGFTVAPLLQASLPTAAIDLLVTHFFLDCFTPDQLAPVVDALALSATPQAQWLISEFRVPASGLGKPIAAALIGVLYLFFRVTTGLRPHRFPAHAPLLAAAGFRLAESRHSLGGMLVSELWRR